MTENSKRKYIELRGLALKEEDLVLAVGGEALNEPNLYLYYYGGYCPFCNSQETTIKIYEYETSYLEKTMCDSCGQTQIIRVSK